VLCRAGERVTGALSAAVFAMADQGCLKYIRDFGEDAVAAVASYLDTIDFQAQDVGRVRQLSPPRPASGALPFFSSIFEALQVS